jgi:transcription elongation factor Elf1
MNTDTDFECPWCTGAMTLAAETATAGDTLACATCSIVVELAPAPVAERVALAA